ncbi:serine palmitoyltransferase 2 isoform X2 [Hyalella azteca]|uniref:serine C-palmitoyltransferase n=1 Tax=Hyalella azteca TaxID=294128 RepID=A0A8B7NZX2_HYAAZ|nr:serine palmitoyltransferase 2 isoform X2 [Hyalella azteca]
MKAEDIINRINLIEKKAPLNGCLLPHNKTKFTPSGPKHNSTSNSFISSVKPDCSKLKGLEVSSVPYVDKHAEELRGEDIPLHVAFFTFLSYGVLLLVGYIKEFFSPPSSKERHREDYVPLFVGFESFYFRNVYRPISDCFCRPICGVPGERMTVLERTSHNNNWDHVLTGRKIDSINVGSYNYLGFAEKTGPCHDAAARAISSLGVAVASARTEMGTLEIHHELEALTAEFVGTEDAITFGMGFATNALNLPSLMGPGCLVLSDECNHASLILGLRLSGATVKVFRHNDCNDLERRIRRAIIDGHPRTRRPWKKVFIIVEGIYSMEGSICNLPRLIEIKKKYKAYLYVDEAHSIGALGPRGRGVVDYHNCDPKDVDILMGTFTKSFAAAGGYIAGSKALIQHLRMSSDAQHYASAMAPAVAQQIITSMSIIMGKDGTDEGQRRLRALKRNIAYFRKHMENRGFLLFGDPDSPVMPLLGLPKGPLSFLVRELSNRGVASVGVGFPATKITGARMRFCLSAGHDKQSLDEVLKHLNELGDVLCCKYNKHKGRADLQIEW